MKSVLISIQPKWCELIASGKKTVEVRKTKPKLDTPFKVYIYCTKPKGKNDLGLCLDKGISGNLKNVGLVYKRNYEAANQMDMQILSGKVIGEFMCDKIIDIDYGIEEGVYFDGEFQEGFETNGNGNNPTCLSFVDLENYLTENEGYGWHISNLVIYDKPRELSEFYVWKKCNACRVTGYESTACMYDENCKVPAIITRPPQSWCYVESEVTK